MHNRREDTGCCSRMFLKSIMVVFNTFFFLSGIVFLLIGLGSFFLRHQYVSLLDSQLYAIITYICIGIGGLILLIGLVGCLGTLKEVRCCLLMYAFVLMAVLILEACVGVLAYLYEGAIHQALNRNLNKTIVEKYSFDPDVTRAVDEMQESFSCCGINHYSDWNYTIWAKAGNVTDVVPFSCCITPNNVSCGLNTHPSNIYHTGCIEDLESYLRLHLIFIGGVALGLSVLQLFGILFSCCLSYKVKTEADL